MRSGNLLLVVVMLTLQLTSATFMHPNSGIAKVEEKKDTTLVSFKPWKEVVVPEIMPTLVDLPNINPDKDAGFLMKVIQIPQSDYYPLRIAHLVTMRSEKQRKEMFEAFHKTYGFDFPGKYSHVNYAKRIDENFEHLLQAILMPRAEYLALEVYWAIDGFMTDEDTLTDVGKTTRFLPDIFCCIDPDVDGITIRDISNTYTKLFGSDMLGDILGDVSGAYGKLLERIISEGREQKMNDENAEHAANVYYINGSEGFCGGEYVYWKFFANHAYREIRMAAQYFYNKSNTDFHQYLERVTLYGCSSGWYDLATRSQSQESFANLVLSIDFSVDKGWYFVRVLHDALRVGDLRRISRLIALRADKDLGLAKTEYIKFVSQEVDAPQSLEQYMVKFLGSRHSDKASVRYQEFVTKIIQGNLDVQRDINSARLWANPTYRHN